MLPLLPVESPLPECDHLFLFMLRHTADTILLKRMNKKDYFLMQRWSIESVSEISLPPCISFSLRLFSCWGSSRTNLKIVHVQSKIFLTHPLDYYNLIFLQGSQWRGNRGRGREWGGREGNRPSIRGRIQEFTSFVDPDTYREPNLCGSGSWPRFAVTLKFKVNFCVALSQCCHIWIFLSYPDPRIRNLEVRIRTDSDPTWFFLWQLKKIGCQAGSKSL